MLAVNALDVDINGTPILRGIGLDINSGEIIGLTFDGTNIANQVVASLLVQYDWSTA